MFNILVSGSDGFVAKYLIPALSENKTYKIIKMNRSSGDIAIQNTWKNLSAANALIHLAGKNSVPESFKKPVDYINTNVKGTMMALEYCRANNTKFIMLSTAYLYGNSDKLPTDETTNLKITNPYVLSKKLSEDLCNFYSKYYGINVIILRLFNVYGLGQNKSTLIPTILNQVNLNTKIIVNDLEIKRDLIYVLDLVDVIIKSIDLECNFEIINIGSGISYSIPEIIQIIQKIKKTNLSVESREIKRPHEILHTQSDITKAKKILKWQPAWSLEKGLRDIISKND